MASALLGLTGFVGILGGNNRTPGDAEVRVEIIILTLSHIYGREIIRKENLLCRRQVEQY